MVDVHAFDYFFTGNLAELPPAFADHPCRKVGDWSNDFDRIAGAEREVLHPLMDENSLKGIDLVGIKSCERQNSQAQSIESFSYCTGETSTIRPRLMKPSRRRFSVSRTNLIPEFFVCTIEGAIAFRLSEKVHEKRSYS